MTPPLQAPSEQNFMTTNMTQLQPRALQTDLLHAAGLTKSYGHGRSAVHVLRGLDLSVRPGEFLAVMGPSGCGKSTLLHVLGLMTPLDAGQLYLDGQLVGGQDAELTLLRRRRIGFVFQRFNLLGVLSGGDNIRISLRVRGIRDTSRLDQLVEQLGVGHVMKRKPGQMSIGEQQRVAMVRALAHRPDLLLADEPTGNLDSANADALLSMLREINTTERQTIVMITHSASAGAYADRVVEMCDGRIIQD